MPNYIGNVNCRFNARSPHLQCTVNPTGDCGNCGEFESRDPVDSILNGVHARVIPDLVLREPDLTN
ncbi:MAG: DUF6464 family protein [Alphaproteobacteria bacterium]